MADEAKLQGDSAFKEGKFEEAVEFYTKAIQQNAINGTNPKHTLLSNRSAAYCSLKKYDKALDDALACISCEPTFAKGYSRKAAALQGKGDLEGAARAFRKLLSLESSNEIAKKELGRIEQLLRTPRESASSASWSNSQASSGAASRKPSWYVDLLLLLGQLFCIFNGVLVIFITNYYESKIAFGRCLLAGLVSFSGQSIVTHGAPSFTTLGRLWRAFRSKASPAEIKQIANFATDNNTHYIFYCSLAISSTPSLVLLVPLLLENLMVGCPRLERLAVLLPAWAGGAKTIATSLCARVLQWDVKGMQGKAEVLVLGALLLQVFTPRRNLLLLILYGQLLRVRYMVSSESRDAWAALTRRADFLLLHPRCPGLVRRAYTAFKATAARLVARSPPPPA